MAKILSQRDGGCGIDTTVGEGVVEFHGQLSPSMNQLLKTESTEWDTLFGERVFDSELNEIRFVKVLLIINAAEIDITHAVVISISGLNVTIGSQTSLSNVKVLVFGV